MGSQPEGADLSLLPWPRSVERGDAVLTLTSARLHADFDGGARERLQRALPRLSDDLARKTGLPLTDSDAVSIRISCLESSAALPGIEEDESYWLVADDAGIYLEAATEWGALRGLVTLGQLVSESGTIPHVSVEDSPRFCWRGLLLDPARHFLPLPALLRTLDGMAQCKLNVLHLHLSDDQGFRLPVPAYPALASRLAYTRGELVDLVSHATELGIRIVPEIDMPGHVTSWLTAYPEWGSRQVAATERFGVHAACLDPSNESVYRAIGQILDVLVDIFPDPCLHIGGDEVSPGWWAEDPGVAELMQRESLADVQAVQGYFNRRVGELVESRGRQVVAWDEVLHGVLPERWIVQAWRGSTARDRALWRGHRTIVSAPYYLDLNYPVDVHYGFDPAAEQAELIAREDALLDDRRFAHVAQGIRWTNQWREGAVADAADKEPLGAEACLWGELVTEQVLDVRLWGRLPALAERFWSAAELADPAELHRRLDHYLDVQQPLRGRDLRAWTATCLNRLGVTGRWQELAGMLEPVKWYGRLLGAEALAARIEGREMPQSRPYDLESPLDELVDHLPPESRAARRLAGLCRSAARNDAAALVEVRSALTRWRALAADVAAARAEMSEQLQELALRLARLADAIEGRLDEARAVDPAALDAIAAPVGELMIAIPPGLHDWLTKR